MPSHQFNRSVCRPREHLDAISRRYPQAWTDIDYMRTTLRGVGVPDWPAWCFVPIAGAQAAVANGLGIDVMRLASLYPAAVGEAASLAALAAWRMTQGIYRFDPALYEAVRDTPVSGDIPHEVMFRLPEWCVYLETPGLTLGTDPVQGVFAHLEHDIHTQRVELRLVLDIDTATGMSLIPVPVHLGAWSLAEAIARVMDVTYSSAAAQGIRVHETDREKTGATLRAVVEPVVSLLLYLCSQASEVAGRTGTPGNPEPVRTRRAGWKLFPVPGPRTWEVGVRLGAALRRAYQTEQTGTAGTHSGPRPHIRRAHWHTILSGPRLRKGQPVPSAQRQAELRWMPPIAVNLEDAVELTATIRKVQ